MITLKSKNKGGTIQSTVNMERDFFPTYEMSANSESGIIEFSIEFHSLLKILYVIPTNPIKNRNTD
jgi:hypothetical protein